VVVYDMATDRALQGVASGTSGTSAHIMGPIPRLNNAGDFTITVVDNALRGGNALRLSDRTNDWNSIEISHDVFDLTTGQTHTIRVRGITNVGTTVIIGAPANPFTQLGSTVAGAGGIFDLTVHVAGNQLTERHFRRGLRISTNDIADITFQEIIVSRG